MASTLTEMQATADAAAAKVRDAQARLESARGEVVQASAAQHQAIVASVSDQPAPPAPPAAAKARAVQASPVTAAAERLAKALAAYDVVRRELGVT